MKKIECTLVLASCYNKKDLTVVDFSKWKKSGDRVDLMIFSPKVEENTISIIEEAKIGRTFRGKWKVYI